MKNLRHIEPKLEYGDYQTPAELARAVCRLVAALGVRPRALLEPTCGVGRFLEAACAEFPSATAALGFEVNPAYVQAARILAPKARIEEANFFSRDWRELVCALPEPVLAIGNPPWVTNSVLGASAGANLPVKSNFQKHNGYDAITGKSNFDISEYMLVRLCEALAGRKAALAMLCKAAVARRVLAYCWKRDLDIGRSDLFPIDARRSFGAAVDACLFVAAFGSGVRERSCTVHTTFAEDAAGTRIAYRDGRLVSGLETYERLSGLRGPGVHTWRSGIKHDCARVLELVESGGQLHNGLGEVVDIETESLYPLLKGSALGGAKPASRWLLVTQRTTGTDPAGAASTSPKTWRYLLNHGARLDARRSSIYRQRPRFSIFGVGPYSFSPWKVAISGLHKKLAFQVVGPQEGKPVVLDDTCYFLACATGQEARRIAQALHSPPAQDFYRSLIFWDAKRPVTAGILNQLDISRLLTED